MPFFIRREIGRINKPIKCMTFFLKPYSSITLSLSLYSLLCLLFIQICWHLIRRDLEYAGFDSDTLDSLWCIKNIHQQEQRNYCHEIIQAFDRRKELIHFKKLLLHLFHEAKKLQTDFKQYCAFFYWFDGDDVQYGIQVHYDALSESTTLLSYLDSYCTNTENNDSSVDIVNKLVSYFTHSLPFSIQLLEESLTHHQDPESCDIRLINRKRLFIIACEQRMFVKGTRCFFGQCRVNAFCPHSLSPYYFIILHCHPSLIPVG